MTENESCHEATKTLSGRIERVTYASKASGFAVLKVRPERGNAFTATGYVPEMTSALEGNTALEGADYQFVGEWTATKYGRQFAFQHAKPTGSELLFFLSKVVKGLGEKLAKELIVRFGETELVSILNDNPEKLLNIKGIKEKKLSLIQRSWQKHKNLRNLTEYFASHNANISPGLLIRIYNHFEGNALEIVQENPYRLTEVRGIGFKTADRVALSVGLPAFSPVRIEAAISHFLLQEAEENGHTYLTVSRLEELVTEGLYVIESQSEPESDLQNKTKIHQIFPDTLEKMITLKQLIKTDKDRIGLSAYRHMEDWLRDFFTERSSVQMRKLISKDETALFIKGFEDANGMEFSEEQKEIIFKVATEPRLAFALAGYAGTGKTTVCKAILQLLSDKFIPAKEMICCAFTGMAASRIRKTTGFESSTIHSLLKYQGEGTFEHGIENPLPYKVIVLDESSMVNLQLFYRLARALRPDTLLLMVGDPAQLPPIGAGNVFSDIIHSNCVPVIQLMRIYRQSEDSVLALFANEIRTGKMPEQIGKTGWQDFAFEEQEPHNLFKLKKQCSEHELKAFREINSQAILDRIQQLAREYSTTLTHPSWDFQTLTPMRIGLLGTEALNTSLQAVLNPDTSKPSVEKGGFIFRLNDKVVHLQNKDMPVMTWDDFVSNRKAFKAAEFRRIYNGSIGLVIGMDMEAEEVYVVYPERFVVAYQFDMLGDILELAYALTVHKAQGSQYKIVVIPLTTSHFIMLNNKWLYTAITRAEQKVYLVGQKYALKRACTNMESVVRQTWLSLS